MPGYVTHYIFGREVYHNLKNNSLKKNLYYNRAAYGLGLQGPDIFFYYLPSYVLEGHNIGALAHVRETSAFFQGLIESRNQFSSRTDLNIAEAYLIGFLGHYTLDTICHPYIYAMTHYKDKKEKAYFSRHAYLETDIDTALLDLKLHRQPCNFHATDTIRLTVEPMSAENPLKRIKDSDRLIITPHIAWASLEARTRLMKIIEGQIRDFFGGSDK